MFCASVILVNLTQQQKQLFEKLKESMNPHAIWILVAVAFCVALYIGWMLGTNSPNETLVKKLRTAAIQKELAKWYLDRPLRCVLVVDGRGGPMGSALRRVILQDENNHEVIQLCYPGSDVSAGSKVELRMREDHEDPLVWVGLVDRFMTVARKTKK